MRVFCFSIIVCLVLLTALPSAAADNIGDNFENDQRAYVVAAADDEPGQGDRSLACEGSCCDETPVTASSLRSHNTSPKAAIIAANGLVATTPYHSLEHSCVWLPPKA
ncbi:MAG: hypothetical protein K1X36_06470 [Pyrinomonadaceae bacterium]|nr:hypothetical protein [Pyrinomonadaceae bacterium]